MPTCANVAESTLRGVPVAELGRRASSEGPIVSNRIDSPKSVTLGSPSCGQQDVAGLEVEVEHARVAGVGVMDRPGDLLDEHGGRARVGLVGFESFGDGPTFHELHDEEPTAAVFTEKVRPDDVVVLHPGDRFGVLAEPGDRTPRRSLPARGAS